MTKGGADVVIDAVGMDGQMSNLEFLATVVVHCPSPSAVVARESARAKKGYGIWSIKELDRIATFRETKASKG